MTESQAFGEMANAIYEMHRLLKDIKTLQRRIKNPDEARKEIRRACVGRLQNALRRAQEAMSEWLSKMEENPQS